MSVTPSNFLDSARALAADGNDEMAKRNAISRAYYAAYHRSCAAVPPQKIAGKTGMHRSYIDQLMATAPGTIERNAAVKLSTLYSRRIKADYRLHEELPAGAVAMQISTATELFQLFNAPALKPALKIISV